MKKIILFGLVLLGLAQAQAQTTPVAPNRPAHRRNQRDSLAPEERKKIRERNAAAFQQLSPEEKEKRKAEMKAKYDQMTPEQKEKARAAMKERYEKMSPEEKAKFRENAGNRADSSANGRRHRGHRPPKRQF